MPTDLGYIDRNSNLGDPTQDHEKNLAKSIGYEFSHDFGNGLRFNQNYRYQHVQNRHLGAYAYPSAYDNNWVPQPLSAANNYSVDRGVND